MDISTLNEVPVDIILPERWWQKPKYRIKMEIVFLSETVPKDFISDGATVPRIFWPIFPPVNRYLIPSIIHDYKLRSGDGWTESNITFKSALEAVGISHLVIDIFMLSVKVYAIYRILIHRDRV